MGAFEEWFKTYSSYEPSSQDHDCWDAGQRAVQVELQKRLAEGKLAIVPLEPTEAMLEAAHDYLDSHRWKFKPEDMHKAMIAAAISEANALQEEK